MAPRYGRISGQENRVTGVTVSIVEDTIARGGSRHLEVRQTERSAGLLQQS
jgi:hypothetical protein